MGFRVPLEKEVIKSLKREQVAEPCKSAHDHLGTAMLSKYRRVSMNPTIWRAVYFSSKGPLLMRITVLTSKG